MAAVAYTKDTSRTAQDLLTLFDRLTAEKRAEVLEALEQREDRYWSERADRAAVEGGEAIPVAEARRLLQRDGII